jgi:hypothetical protein
MRLKILLPTILILAFGSSIFAFSDPVIKTVKRQELPSVVLELEQAIQSASYDPLDRNSKLRYERAVQYYGYAIDHVKAKWHKQAIDNAERGLGLLKMNKQNTTKLELAQTNIYL